jgi:hypothetical protein
MLTMLLGGLWHGASWTFVAWGGLHGVYLVTNHAWRALTRRARRSGQGDASRRARQAAGDAGFTRAARHALSWSVTFLAVVVAWVVFRAETFVGAQNILLGMAGQQGFVLPAQIAGMLPIDLPFIQTVGKMQLLADGTVMGAFTAAAMLALCFALIAMPATQSMSNRLRLAAMVVGFYFTVQGVFFGYEPAEFLYFQF